MPRPTPTTACEVTPRTILEAMLFVGSPQNEPLSARQVAGLMRGVRPAEIDALVRELNRDYAGPGVPLSRSWPREPVTGCSLREDFARMRDKFYGKARQARLSQAADRGAGGGGLSTGNHGRGAVACAVSPAVTRCRNWFVADWCGWSATRRSRAARGTTRPIAS